MYEKGLVFGIPCAIRLFVEPQNLSGMVNLRHAHALTSVRSDLVFALALIRKGRLFKLVRCSEVDV